MGTIFIRALIFIFCCYFFSVRLMGKRQLGELQPSGTGHHHPNFQHCDAATGGHCHSPAARYSAHSVDGFALKSSFRGFPSRVAVCGV